MRLLLSWRLVKWSTYFHHSCCVASQLAFQGSQGDIWLYLKSGSSVLIKPLINANNSANHVVQLWPSLNWMRKKDCQLLSAEFLLWLLFVRFVSQAFQQTWLQKHTIKAMCFLVSRCQADKVRPWKGMPYATKFEIEVDSICYQM